jgi:hypothetical protein
MQNTLKKIPSIQKDKISKIVLIKYLIHLMGISFEEIFIFRFCH